MNAGILSSAGIRRRAIPELSVSVEQSWEGYQQIGSQRTYESRKKGCKSCLQTLLIRKTKDYETHEEMIRTQTSIGWWWKLPAEF